MPYGHVDARGLKFIDTIADPADFAAFKNAHIDALNHYIGPAGTLINAITNNEADGQTRSMSVN
jgi:hypothetical protein